MNLRSVTSGLRTRLLMMLIPPVVALALLSAWLDYRAAASVALEQDQRLAALVPLLADSLLSPGNRQTDSPVFLLAPAIARFLESPATSSIAIIDESGRLVHGEEWLVGQAPDTTEAVFENAEHDGVTWRIVRQRQASVLGNVVIVLADASDPRQQWGRNIVLKALLPNLVLAALAVFAVRWTVQRALKPLLDLRDALERRSPRDLTAFDARGSPDEVRPLVESLNRLLGLVNAQAESQRRFIGDAAHQLRTPLASLQAQVEAWAQAADSQTPPRQTIELPTQQVHKLQNATRRTSQLASQLLALSRADAHAIAAQPMRPVELKELCASLLEVHLDAAAAKQIDLGLDAEPVQAWGHEWLLRELLANLVDNAVKYTPPRGTVTIRCGQRDGRPFLEVEDDGPGVPLDQRGQVTQRFYRMSGTQGEGNGLGLAIADEIARAHGGQLELDSGAHGRGLKVTLLLAG